METTDMLFSKRPTDPEKPAHCESEGQVSLGLADICGDRDSHLAHGQTFRVRNQTCPYNTLPTKTNCTRWVGGVECAGQ